MRRALLVCLVGAVVVLAGCSGQGQTAGPTTVAPGSAATGAAPTAGAGPTTPEAAPGDIPDTTVFVPYQPGSGLYAVKVPQGWARTSSGATTTFTENLNSVALDSHPAPAAPTVASARATEVPMLASAVPGFSLLDVTTVTRTADAVVEIHYQTDSAANSVTGKTTRDDVARYEFFHNGTEAIVTVAGPVGADNVDAWRTITDSLRWLR
ncbi:MAG: hypothetical protein DLM62_02110 [Pseudonocardiales bacterium]|nr:MAG: hypothetical protein DLM62_02110 [Pseudonocardiales bacterium]